MADMAGKGCHHTAPETGGKRILLIPYRILVELDDFPEIRVGKASETGLSQPPYGIHTGHQSSQRTRRPI